MSARLSGIWVYPVKALNGFHRPRSAVLPTGALAGDRCFALRTGEGHFLNSKRTPAVHQLVLEWQFETSHCSFSTEEQRSSIYHAATDRVAIEQWLSDWFGEPIRWDEDPQNGFPDDLAAPGPTLVSTATLQEVASWFSLSLDETRRRFRANLEIEGVPPFWEDSLCGPGTGRQTLAIGEATFVCTNRCRRCVTPSRAPDTGEVTPRFVPTFVQRREQSLPSWVRPQDFDHFYYLAVNTRLDSLSGSGEIAVGDEVRVVPR